jgi:hypothetical protein
LTVAPTVTISVASVQTTLVDSTHVLDTGGVDPGSCPPQHNESAQWRPIGAEGANAATLSLTPGTMTQFSGHPADVIATVLDGGGSGIPNAMVAFTVTSGPDAGQSGTATTDTDGHASFSFTGVHEGEDVVVASVTTVGTFQSNTARVMWADDSSSGWSSSDIGNPTLTGGQSLDTSTGTWTVQGAGTGVSGTADEFHFVWQAQGAGGGVGADVTSQTNTGAVAQAGVMLRASTDSGSPYYAAFVTPSDGIIVQDRATQGAGAVTVANAPGTAPTYLWVTDTGSIFTTYSSVDGYNWTSVAGSTVSLNLSPTLLAGLAATSDDGAQVSAVTFNSVAVSTSSPVPPPPAPCPSPWSCADIGNPTLVGSQSFDPGTNTWTISAGGSDITGTADQFHFVSQPLSGDGSISARVASQTNSSSNAKAGVMLRATTDPGSPNYAVLVSPGAGIKVQERSVQGGTTVKLANPAGTAPAYVKVTRSGNTFTAYTSADGVTWNLIAGSTFTMTLGSTVLEGLAVTSHNSGILGTATMDTVSAASGSAPPPAPTVTGLSPNSGAAAGGTSVTITGTNLTGATAVRFGATAAPTFAVSSASSVTATSPAESAGTTDVTVTTPAGTSAVNPPSDQFTFTTSAAQPTVTGLSPNSGAAAGGTSVTITGTNFTEVASVRFGTVAAATFAVNSASSMTAISPAEAAGTVDVTVTTPAGSNAPTSADRFSYGTSSPCPSPWSCADIGNPTLVGSQSFDPGTNTWTISAGGSDITGTADQFHFVSQPLSGDGSISARVASQTNSSSNAKAGVMLRATTDPGSPNYAVLVSPGAGIKVQERSVQGGTTVKLANPAGTAPAYVKVTRSGNTFTAYTSADGVTWNLIAGSTFTMTLGSTVLEGLAVTSHNSGILGTATMDTVKPS